MDWRFGWLHLLALLVLVPWAEGTFVGTPAPPAPPTTGPRDHPPSSTTQLQDLAPHLLAHLLSPAHGVGPRQAHALVTRVRGLGPALPVHVRFFHWATTTLGLDPALPSSTFTAFCGCMQWTSEKRAQLARVLGLSSGSTTGSDSEGIPVPPPSTCVRLLLEVLEDPPADLPSGPWDPVPLGLRFSSALLLAAEGDDGFLDAVGRGTTLVPELAQALFYARVRHMGQGLASANPGDVLQGLDALTYNNSALARMLIPGTLPALRALAAVQLVEGAEALAGDARMRTSVSSSPQLLVALRAVPGFAEARQHLPQLREEFILAVDRAAQPEPGTADSRLALDALRLTLRQLLDRGLDINGLRCGSLTDSGDHPVIRAIRARRAPVVRILLKAGYDPNTRCGSVDLLVLTVISHRTEIAMLLLEQGALLHARYHSILHSHIREDTTREEVEGFMQYGASLNTVNNEGLTLLHVATTYNNVGIVDFLLHHPAFDRGRLSGARTRSGESAFLRACASRAAGTILPYFLGGYAGPVSLAERDAQGRTCSRLLSRTHCGAMLKEVRRLERRLTSSFFSSSSSSLSTWRAWLRSRGNSSASAAPLLLPLPGEGTYFYRACVSSGSLGVLRAMLARDADINEPDPEGSGHTCLLHALDQKSMTLLQFLLSYPQLDVRPSRAPSASTSCGGGGGPGFSAGCWMLPLHAAALRPPLRSSPLLASVQAGFSFFHALVEGGYRRNVDLLEDVAEVRAALRLAALLRSSRTVRYLLLSPRERLSLALDMAG